MDTNTTDFGGSKENVEKVAPAVKTEEKKTVTVEDVADVPDPDEDDLDDLDGKLLSATHPNFN